MFLFLLQNIDCGYSLEPPRRGGSNIVPKIYVLSKNKNKWPKGNDHSPNSPQLQSLDKVVGFFAIYGYGGHLGHETLKPYLHVHQQNSSCLDCVSSCSPFWFT